MTVWRKPRRVDVFGQVKVKSIEEEFYPTDSEEVYEILQFEKGMPSHVATVTLEENSEGIVEGQPDVNESYFSELLEDHSGSDRYNVVERFEERVYEEIGLEYPSDLRLVELLEEDEVL